MIREVGKGDFYYPHIFTQSKEYVTRHFKEGNIDHSDFSSWTFADKFMAYVLGERFLEFVDRTYPTPRAKTEVPVWFLVSCQLIMRMMTKNSYKGLDNLMLRAGPVLLRVGFNVASTKLGFNDKNKKERTTPVHQDTVRKFFKDTDPQAIRDWYNREIQAWLKARRYFDARGIYVLDQTHCVVPDNENYQDAVKMPVDEHGQRYKDIKHLTAEQKKAVRYHPCYTLSSLLHLTYERNSFHIAGYEWGPGNEDELPQGRKLIKNFHEGNKIGTIKLLIVDRGYVSGSFITELKRDYKIDILVPLRKNMDQYTDAIAISQMSQTVWEEYEEKDELTEEVIAHYRACTISDVFLWEECKVKLYTTVVEKRYFNKEEKKGETRRWVLVSTKKFLSATSLAKTYGLRTEIEERYKQLKNFWEIAQFPSPHKSLIETQICFTLLTYSLLQSYLMRNDLQQYANKTITTLRQEEALGKNTIVTYVDDKYAVYDTKECFGIINNLETQEARERLQSWINKRQNNF